MYKYIRFDTDSKKTVKCSKCSYIPLKILGKFPLDEKVTNMVYV